MVETGKKSGQATLPNTNNRETRNDSGKITALNTPADNEEVGACSVDVDEELKTGRRRIRPFRGGRGRNRYRNPKLIDPAVPTMHGVVTVDWRGNPKSPAILLHDVVLHLFPSFEIFSFVEKGSKGQRITMHRCVVGEIVTEARGSFKKSRDKVMEEMITLLGGASAFGLSSEDARETSSLSSADAVAVGVPEAKDLKGKEVRVSPPIVRLTKLLRALEGPAVKYTVMNEFETPDGKFYTTRCEVKHLSASGVGGNMQLSKAAAATRMLEILKSFPPKVNE